MTTDCATVVAQFEPRPRESVVVLRNGHVIRGRVTLAGDRYLVVPSVGGQIAIPRPDVQLVTATLHEAYYQKRDALPTDNVKSHLALGEWCLRQKLVPEAADQVLAAFAIEPRNRQVQALEQRLWLEVQSESPPPVAKRVPRTSSTPLADGENLVGAISAQSMERFVHTIQPFFLSRCAANSCHGVSSQAELKFIRPRSVEAMAAKFTRRNLSAVMARIDRDSPRSSLLLTTVIKPHATIGPLMAENDRLYDRILEWIGSLSDSDGSAKLSARNSGSRMAEVVRDSRSTIYDPAVQPMSNQKPVDRDNKLRGGNRKSQSAEDSGTSNPLDPEIFNTRFRDEN